jgi:hypothetical protein
VHLSPTALLASLALPALLAPPALPALLFDILELFISIKLL